MGEDYHANVDAAYGHATRASPPEGYKPLGENEGKRGPYDTAGGNAAQAGEGGGSTHAGGQTFEPTTAREAVPDTGYRAQPYTSGNMRAGGNSTGTEQTRSTGSKVKEMAHGVKGLFAAVHGAGEKARGDFNAGVDRTFNETSGEQKNRSLAVEGKQEMQTGMFSERTKEREGVVPGDKDLRQNRDL